MTDRIEAAARALHATGCWRCGGNWPCLVNASSLSRWYGEARVALAAADAVDPVREAARKVCIDSGDLTLGQAIDALGVALAAK